MQITITSRKAGIFDSCPICDVIIDSVCVSKILPGKTLSYNLDANCSHSIYCSYNYGKCNVEKSNVIHLNDGNMHNLVLGVVYSKTYIGCLKENLNTLFTKGYINTPDIELYEVNDK